MSAAREQILARIRAALGRGDGDAAAAAADAARARIATHPRQIEPVFDEPLAQRFRAKLEAVEVTFDEVSAVNEVGAAVAEYLAARNLEPRLVSSGEALLREVDWPDGFSVEQRLPSGADTVGITSVLCAIAETGTLMLTSGANKPTSLNFLPDYHIVVLTRAQLLPRMEDAWDFLRDGRSGMPRSVNFISGPSKTADVEQTVEYGAHGPRCLHVILVG